MLLEDMAMKGLNRQIKLMALVMVYLNLVREEMSLYTMQNIADAGVEVVCIVIAIQNVELKLMQLTEFLYSYLV